MLWDCIRIDVCCLDEGAPTDSCPFLNCIFMQREKEDSVCVC